MRTSLCLALPAALGLAFLSTAIAETHSNLQAVNADGTSSWAGSLPVTLKGVLLTDPTEMLDSTPAFLPWENGANQFRMGAEWQIVFQAVDPGDRGGTTCWMGQNYGNMPWIHDSALSYSNAGWVSEILLLNHDPETGRAFRKGDLVEITANRSLFYGGKRNVNEAHESSPDADFSVKLITASYGLPAPEALTLADLTRVDDGDASTSEEIFDPTRQTGGEHYQGMRVRLNGLTLVSSTGWDPAAPWGSRLCRVTDGANRFFTLRHPRYSLGSAPTHRFDAIGVLSQESGSGTQGTNGYELFVQQVLPQQAPDLAIASKVVISWSDVQGTFELEQSSEAAGGTWSPVPGAPLVVDGSATVLLPPSASRQFYRLKRKE